MIWSSLYSGEGPRDSRRADKFTKVDHQPISIRLRVGGGEDEIKEAHDFEAVEKIKTIDRYSSGPR